jgi:hypothetical protein
MTPRAPRNRLRRDLWLEELERRETPAAPVMVTNTADDGSATSLRSAIIAANTNGEPDTIVLTDGATYTLSIDGFGDAAGDLDVTEDLTIRTDGPGGATILAAFSDQPDRVLHVLPRFSGPVSLLVLDGITVTNGNSNEYGGGIAAEQGSSLMLIDSVVTGNTVQAPGAFGGGISLTGGGTLTLTNSTVSGNRAIGDDGSGTTGPAQGGGIYVNGGTLNVTGGSIADNLAQAGDGMFAAGGGVFVANSQATLTGVTLLRNLALGGSELDLGEGTIPAGEALGGGLHAEFGPSLVLRGVTASDNQAIGGDKVVLLSTSTGGNATGGGVSVLGVGTTVLEDLTLTGNIALGGDGPQSSAGSALGGGLALRQTTLSPILRARVSGNIAQGGDGFTGGDAEGGGVAIVSGGTTATFVDSFLDGNLAQGGQGIVQGGTAYGGGILARPDFIMETPSPVRLELVSSTLATNIARGGEVNDGGAGGGLGGGAYVSATARFGTPVPGSGLLAVNSTVSGNRAEAGGGALGNGTARGGGLFLAAGTTNLLSNSTITLNVAVPGSTVEVVQVPARVLLGTGGGVFAEPDIEGVDAAVVQMRSTILAGNSDPTSPDGFGNFVSLGNNLVGIDLGITGLVNGVNGDLVGSTSAPIEPLLAPLAFNGGLTPTHALLDGSPAIDTGNNAAGLADDQRGTGFARTVGVNTDIGAFERQPDPPPMPMPLPEPLPLPMPIPEALPTPPADVVPQIIPTVPVTPLPPPPTPPAPVLVQGVNFFIFPEDPNARRGLALFDIIPGPPDPAAPPASDTPPPDRPLVFYGLAYRLSGFALPGEIRGQVFVDLNGNGQHDPEEPYRVGQIIWVDVNENGVLDPEERWTVTDDAGKYEFLQVAAGRHPVRLQLGPKADQTFPSQQLQVVELTPSHRVATDVDFGTRERRVRRAGPTLASPATPIPERPAPAAKPVTPPPSEMSEGWAAAAAATLAGLLGTRRRLRRRKG